MRSAWFQRFGWALPLVYAAGATFVVNHLSERAVGRAEEAAAPGSAPEPEPSSPNVLLVVLDTVNAERLNVYRRRSPSTTPFLDTVAHELVRYDQAKSAAPWTIPSHSSMLTALWPSEHRAQWGNIHLAERHTTLAEVLRQEGYCTAGFSANNFLTAEAGFAQGFDSFENVGGPDHDRSRTLLDGVAKKLPALLEKDCPVFLFLNLMDAHIPYHYQPYQKEFRVRPPPPVNSSGDKWEVNAGNKKLDAREWDQHRRAYDAAIRYLDDAIRELFNRFRSYGLLDHTIVILTADHGDGMGYHGEVGHSISVWEEQLHVPLLVRLPGAERGGERVAAPVSTVGLTPSVLAWAGIEPPAPLRGRPTLEGTQESFILADYRDYFQEVDRGFNADMGKHYPALAARVGHRHVLYCGHEKLIVPEEGAALFFDLDKDPHEQENLFGTGNTNLTECRGRYDALARDGLFTPFEDVSETNESAVDLDTLRALGYVQ